MGVEKAVLRRGNGTDIPKKHDEVAIEYTGSTIFSRAKTSLTKLQDGSTTTTHQIRKANSELHHHHVTLRVELHPQI